MTSGVGDVLDPVTGSGDHQHARITASGRSQRWLHLPVETKVREFEARILLACVAAERGFGSVVGIKGGVAKIADRLPRGIYMEKSAQLMSFRGVETRARLGHVECCLDEEGVVYIDADEYTEGRLGRPVLERFHRFFAWGEDQATIVGDWYPPIADRIRVTGNPRVDFWRPELRPLHAASAEVLRGSEPFVLLTTAFAMVNNSGGGDHFVAALRSNGRLDTEKGASQVEGYIAHSKRLFDEMITAVGELARARPSLRIVVRPHPSEDPTTWEAATRDCPNVTVCGEGTVTPWLLAADAVVHNNSTTGLEAALLGRPTIAFVPMVDARYDQNLPNNVSHQATTVAQLIDLLDKAMQPQGLPAQETSSELLGRHIASLEGPLASDRLVSEFDQIDVPVARLASGVGRRLRSQATLGAMRVSRALGRIEKVAPGPVAGEKRGGAERFPPTSITEVASFIDQLDQVTGRFGDVTCWELADRVFVIEPAGS